MSDLLKTKYYLAIDWGKARCGLAIADEETRIATGFKEVQRAQLSEEIEKITKEFAVDKVIFGEIEGENESEAQKDIDKIKALGFEVELTEEKFSTQQANKNLAQAGFKNISQNDNIESARIILQSWLDRN